MAVNHLTQDQFAFYLGEKLSFRETPKLTIAKVTSGTREYKFTLEFVVQAEFENPDPDVMEIPLPGSFAVMDIITDQDLPADEFSLFFNSVEGSTGSSLVLQKSLSVTIPGDKGTHGN